MKNLFFKSIYRSVMTTIALGIILCGFYPLVVYGLGNLIFPQQASGGIIVVGGKTVGAKLIGQGFSKPEYFHGRPSSAGDKGYDAANSSGSNLGPTNQKFYDTLKGNIDAVLKENPTLKKGEVPGDLVTSSGSGLDPHISPAAAYAQVDRVAAARHVSVESLKKLIDEKTEGAQWGLFGEPVVNVLLLNLELDHSVH
jgi:K+-transporting ATPase ATPase C chain